MKLLALSYQSGFFCQGQAAWHGCENVGKVQAAAGAPPPQEGGNGGATAAWAALS